MGSSPRTRNQVIAAVFLCLLIGSEGARVKFQANTGRAKTDSVGGVGATRFFGGSEVCRPEEMDDTTSTAAMLRYKDKIQTYESLAGELKEPECATGCASKWVELRQRMKKFGGCSAVVEDAAAAPKGLAATMKREKYSLSRVYLAPIDALNAAIRNGGLFPTIGECSFNPMKMEMIAEMSAASFDGDVHEFVHKSLFGNDCNEKAAKAYVAELEDEAKVIVKDTVELFERAYMVARQAKMESQRKSSTPGNPDAEVIQHVVVGAQTIVDEYHLKDPVDDEVDAEAFEEASADALLEEEEEEEEEDQELIEDESQARRRPSYSYERDYEYRRPRPRYSTRRSKGNPLFRLIKFLFKFIWKLIKVILVLLFIGVIICLIVGMNAGAALGVGAVAAGYQAVFAPLIPLITPILAQIGVAATAAANWVATVAWPAIVGYITELGVATGGGAAAAAAGGAR